MTATHAAVTGHAPLATAGGTSAGGAVGVAFLASGSRGNCTLVHSHGRGVLVDCGLSAKEAVRRIADAGLADVHIEALLLTHEHTDHVCGARVIARRLGIPVYATRGTVGRARSALADVPEVLALRSGDTLSLAGLGVIVFRTSHDAAEPVGYTFTTPRGTIGVATDTGVLTAEAWEVLPGCRVLGLEANHDLDMLEYGPYPHFLKQRIRSDVGHLSNASAAGALERLAGDGLGTLVGLHLSEQNNQPELARRTLAATARQLGLAADVLVASQSRAVVCTL
jgi:phosphoribosyl 1,2-cyclic phosphodiesterase